MATSNKSSAELMTEMELERKKLEIQKLKIETEKIQLEKSDLQKPWYKKPQWWGVMAPFIIGAGTIFIAFSTGIISVERLKNEKAELEKKNNSLKDSIDFFSVYAEAQKDSLSMILKQEQVKFFQIKSVTDSLRATVKGKNDIIRSRDIEELQRLEQKIYMYEDHDSLYYKIDELTGDTASDRIRKQHLAEFRKTRDDLKQKLGM